MNLYQSELYRRDLKTTAEYLTFMEQLKGCSILVTGAAGLICSAVVDLMAAANEMYDLGLQIYAAGRNEEKMRARFCAIEGKPYFHFVQYDAGKALSFDFHADYIIHGASIAHPAAMQKQPVETMTGNFDGILNLLNYAKEQNSKRLLFVSSSEVYGKRADQARINEPFAEDEYGFVDLLNPRSCYSVSKRAAETMCASFAAEYGIESVIVRPGHIYGPTAARSDTRVSSAFAYRAADGEDLVMKSDGSQLRSYCYVLDTASAMLTVLLLGKAQEAYNISNPDSIITIRQMAEELAKAGEVALKLELPSESEKKAFNPMPNSSLNSQKLEALGWKGLFDAKTGLSHTVQIIREADLL